MLEHSINTTGLSLIPYLVEHSSYSFQSPFFQSLDTALDIEAENMGSSLLSSALSIKH